MDTVLSSQFKTPARIFDAQDKIRKLEGTCEHLDTCQKGNLVFMERLKARVEELEKWQAEATSLIKTILTKATDAEVRVKAMESLAIVEHEEDEEEDAEDMEE